MRGGIVLLHSALIVIILDIIIKIKFFISRTQTDNLSTYSAILGFNLFDAVERQVIGPPVNGNARRWIIVIPSDKTSWVGVTTKDAPDPTAWLRLCTAISFNDRKLLKS